MLFWMFVFRFVLRFVPKINQVVRFVPARRLYFCGSEIYGRKDKHCPQSKHYDNNGKEKVVSCMPFQDILILSLVPAYG